ncbi:MAG: hypothetical protein IPL45_00235 [Actinomycetales bacterium]|nr:hypothetical protein [Actinomycetales bacterium]
MSDRGGRARRRNLVLRHGRHKDARKNFTMTSMTRTRRIAISAIALATVAVIVMIMFASRPTSSAVAGMEHSTPAADHETSASHAHAAGDDPVSGEMPRMNMVESSPTPTMSEDMPGMDHGSGHTHESTPTHPAMSEDMPGMDHGSGHTHESTPTHPTMSEEMPGMDHGSGEGAEPGHGGGDTGGSGHGSGDTSAADPDRPLAPVMSAFGGGTLAVMVTAGFLRRRDRVAAEIKQAARAARRSQE